MPNTYPTKDELSVIRTSLAENGVTDARALPMAIEDFRKGEFSESGVDSYVVLLQEKLKATPAATDGIGLGEHQELATKAFEGRGDAQARSDLVRAVGKDEADKIAIKFGVAGGVGDFKSVGVVPADVKPADKDTTNPWSPKYKGKTPAEDERIRVIKNRGTKYASDLAKSAGTDLAGRPLRGAA